MMDMDLYLYKIGKAKPVMTIEDVTWYTDSEARTKEGTIYGPFAPDVELSRLPDCSETLRSDWRRANSPADYPELMTLEERQTIKLAELSAACNAAIVGGCDVSLSDGSTGHIALTNEDQINLTNAVTTVSAGTERYPYHLDGQLCAMYPAADILAMGQAATAHKLYHTTYYNHLAAWVRRCGTAEELETVTYGAALPEDLAASMAGILAAAGA